MVQNSMSRLDFDDNIWQNHELLYRMYTQEYYKRTKSYYFSSTNTKTPAKKLRKGLSDCNGESISQKSA